MSKCILLALYANRSKQQKLRIPIASTEKEKSFTSSRTDQLIKAKILMLHKRAAPPGFCRLLRLCYATSKRQSPVCLTPPLFWAITHTFHFSHTCTFSREEQCTNANFYQTHTTPVHSQPIHQTAIHYYFIIMYT